MLPYIRMLVLAITAAPGLWAQNTYSVTNVANNVPDYSYSAHGINNAGQVVGMINATFSPLKGFLYSGGTLNKFVLGPAAAINNSGVIVGSSPYYLAGVGHWQAYLCSGACSSGQSTLLGFLGGMDSGASGINDSGQVVGYATTASGNAEAFLYSDGVMTGLGFLPGGTQGGATGINNSGQVVGYSTNASGNKEAFLYSGGVMTGLGTLPGYIDSVAYAINESGQIVGYATDPSGNAQAFLYGGGVMTGLGTLPGAVGSMAEAINNAGQIVGRSGRSDVWYWDAFVYSNGQMYDLNLLFRPGATETLADATAINDFGQFAVNGSIGSVYLLTPLRSQGRFVPVTPCRLADTRTSGWVGGGALDGVSARSFAIAPSWCGIPATAQAYSLNVTAVPHGPLGYLTVWPDGMAQPVVSTLNSWQGNVVANAAIIAAGQDGAVSVFASDPTDVILDIDGYFDATAGDSFYPVQPCRVADTRRQYGPLGGPALSAGETRSIPMLSGPCGLPAAATAYSMNATVVPTGYLGFLTTWAAGQPQPIASTLNSWTGTVVANAALVPAGANGATSVYVTNPTDVILDTNGYFAPPGSPGALTFYAVVPCRVADTRNPDGPFGGPEMEGGETRSFAIPASSCGIPSTAAAYSMNITVVPDGPLGYLMAWPTGAPQPFVSTLNSWDGTVVANAAIVPAGAGGAISVYTYSAHSTHVIVDVNGYFAP